MQENGIVMVVKCGKRKSGPLVTKELGQHCLHNTPISGLKRVKPRNKTVSKVDSYAGDHSARHTCTTNGSAPVTSALERTGCFN